MTVKAAKRWFDVDVKVKVTLALDDEEVNHIESSYKEEEAEEELLTRSEQEAEKVLTQIFEYHEVETHIVSAINRERNQD